MGVSTEDSNNTHFTSIRICLEREFCVNKNRNGMPNIVDRVGIYIRVIVGGQLLSQRIRIFILSRIRKEVEMCFCILLLKAFFSL